MALTLTPSGAHSLASARVSGCRPDIDDAATAALDEGPAQRELPSRRNRSKAAQLQSEIIARVEERDVLCQAAEQLAVVRQQAAPDVVAEEVADQAAEVLVARVGEEAARVGDH